MGRISGAGPAMTAARALAALTEAFEEAGRLNRSALLQLREGGDLGALEALFLAKQALSEELEALLPHLEGARQDPGLQEALANTQGSYASLAERLHAIEENNAANHADASKALGRRP